VLFEIPGFERALRLCEHLADRFSWVEARGERRLVAVMLRPKEGDLAALLRTVDEWAVERGLVTVPFELDGRAYVLDAGHAIWASVAA